MLNSAMADVHGAAVSRTGDLSEANNSIRDLRLKLEDLEKMLSEAKAREGTLTKDLETKKQLRRNEAANLNDHVEGEKRWLERLAVIANSATMQLVTMVMLDVRYAPETSVSPNASLTLFFERVVGALERLHSNWAASLAKESWKLCRGAMTKVLAKIAHWHPDLDFEAALKSLPEDADVTALKERIKPIISCIDGIKRLEGQCRD